MDIQFEVQKIHSQFGTTEMANYQIQKLFDQAVKAAVTEALRMHDVVGKSEQLKCDCGKTEDVKLIPICNDCYNNGEW
jgi:hypothetical protein